MGASRNIADVTEKALSWLHSLPRMTRYNIRQQPGEGFKYKRGRGQHGGTKHGYGNKTARARQNYPALGEELGPKSFYLSFSREPYYEGHHLKRQYPPFSLQQVQMLIDTDRIDTSTLIDLAALKRTGVYHFDPEWMHFGVNLTEEGLNKFAAKIDIEVQWTTEPVIAAIERLGGSITMAYYDIQCLTALQNPLAFFKKGLPIPRRMQPPQDAIEAYTNPKLRGYLADPQAVEYERGVLAQKYGYELVQREPAVKKDPRQVFLGLEPGWIVNLADKTILKPKDPKLMGYYSS